MKPIKYAHFCEDISTRVFLQNMLAQFPQHENVKVSFELNHDFAWRYRASNKGEVLNQYVDASISAFRDYKVETLFVGIDYDDWDQKIFLAKHSELKDALPEKLRSNTIIFLPIQAVEHWLCYLKQKADNPNITKNIPQENKDRGMAKHEIYGSKRPTTPLCETKVNELTSPLDFDWLISRSNSFQHFYDQLKKFVADAT